MHRRQMWVNSVAMHISAKSWAARKSKINLKMGRIVCTVRALWTIMYLIIIITIWILRSSRILEHSLLLRPFYRRDVPSNKWQTYAKSWQFMLIESIISQRLVLSVTYQKTSFSFSSTCATTKKHTQICLSSWNEPYVSLGSSTPNKCQ